MSWIPCVCMVSKSIWQRIKPVSVTGMISLAKKMLMRKSRNRYNWLQWYWEVLTLKTPVCHGWIRPLVKHSGSAIWICPPANWSLVSPLISKWTWKQSLVSLRSKQIYRCRELPLMILTQKFMHSTPLRLQQSWQARISLVARPILNLIQALCSTWKKTPCRSMIWHSVF